MSIIEATALAWSRVSTDIFFKFHTANTPELIQNSNRVPYADAWTPCEPHWGDYTLVVLSLAFFYMVCFLIHRQIEDYFEFRRLRSMNERLRQQMLDPDVNNSTQNKAPQNP